MALAIFDLDETLIAADSDHLWGEYVVEAGLVNADVHRAKNDAFYEQYKAGQLNLDAYLEFSFSVLARYSMQELEEHRSAFIKRYIQPIVLPKAVELVNRHRSSGDEVLIITSTNSFVTRPIADLFDIIPALTARLGSATANETP